ncbi:hypothetical protein [Pseudobutyrivibrio sp.]|uniref:hypothetical protein n=1 Tax=Pseudobutyrivibrio sp. TaxID=2014367 RepID=UPI001E10BCB3|nr:hypothetical protein [Pseudobutyrivibrio sp.]MBE5911551.1 hypothetical protein [Pseudobutyrivibrio sp.]
MSVGKGSIKRAADATAKKAPTTKKAPAKATVNPDTKKAPAKATVKPDTKKSSIKKTEEARPVSNSTSDIHYGVGSELPIFLM